MIDQLATKSQRTFAVTAATLAERLSETQKSCRINPSSATCGKITNVGQMISIVAGLVQFAYEHVRSVFSLLHTEHPHLAF